MASGNWRKLRDFMEARGVTLEALAARIGRSRGYVWRRWLPPAHPQHKSLTASELLELCGAAQAIAEERASLPVPPAEVLGQ
jgi:hypothetical protein